MPPTTPTTAIVVGLSAMLVTYRPLTATEPQALTIYLNAGAAVETVAADTRALVIVGPPADDAWNYFAPSIPPALTFT